MKTLSIFLLAFTLASTSVAVGHEFWISPEDYTVEPGENIVANLRVGQGFEGVKFSYIPSNFERFELVNGATVLDVEARIGDRPALNMQAPGPGLWIVVHETTDSRLTYQEWDTFFSFVQHKDLSGTLENHAARGLPQVKFKEVYRRFVKSLIAVGAGAGADQNVGLRTEIIAGLNPYTDDLSGGMPVTVFFEGAPRVDVLVEIFDRDSAGVVTITTTRTDLNGQANIPVSDGHEYNLDAVVMLPVNASDPLVDPVWLSLWAGLTFAVPQ